MRLRRLDLIRYGRFTGARLDLPAGKPDLHIVVGPNEAGKSTVRSAVGDLLFGIPARSTLDFLHEYGSMRIGAVLEAGSETLEVRRRKGNRDTLLAADDSRLAAGEQALRPFLQGADRGFFERMFSLDHLQLRAGGEEILHGDADGAGEKLFAAGSGIRGLQRRLKELDDEAGSLWTKRRAGARKYYIAHDRLKEAESRLREKAVSTDRWRKLRQAYEDSAQERDRLDGRIRQQDQELRKVSRIRRVARAVGQRSRHRQEIEGLGRVAEIPADSAKRLQDAQDSLRRSAPELEYKESELRKARAARESIRWDENLLRRKSDIDRLHQQRMPVKKGADDLPGLGRKLAERQEQLTAMAADCGWHDSDAEAIASKIPPRSRVDAARTLLSNLSAQRTRAKSSRASAEEAATRAAEIRRELEAAGVPQDTRALADLLAATKNEHGGIGSQIAGARAEAAEDRADVERLYSDLDPRPDSVEAALSLAPPSTAEALLFRDRRRDLDQRLRDHRERQAAQTKELAIAEEAIRQLVADGEPVTLEHVLKARESRNKLWLALRDRFIDKGAPGRAETGALEKDPERLADQYQDEVARADQLGDLRSDTARSTAEVAAAKRRIAAVKSDLAGTERELERLAQEDRQMVSEWSALWSASAVNPHGPDRMLAWLATRDRLSEAVARSGKSRRRLAGLRDQESQAVQALAKELGQLGEDCNRLARQRLSIVLERAGQVQAENARMAESGKRLQEARQRAEADASAKHSQLESDEAELGRIEQEWAALAGKLAMDPQAAQAAADMLDTFGDMRAEASAIRELRADRIEKIERDIERFRTEVTALAQALGPDLAGQDPGQAIDELQLRLKAAEAAKHEADTKHSEIQALEKRVGELKASQQASQTAIHDLQAQAGAADVKGLREAIEKAAKRASLRKSVVDLEEEIQQGGDGLPLEQLVAECADADLDNLARQQKELEASVEELRQRREAAQDGFRDAEAEFGKVGSSAAAAHAESARQSALAEIQEIAEQFLQVRTAACLLRWAIDRYRRERQGPMLQRAGELFATLTLGSFDHLELDFDEQDRAQIVGCRQTGERVPTSGMSEGSADQLYLALRMAALEDYLEQSPQMPFMADDLFINFDDARSAAGFKLLHGLARRCQVIFFTHHDHLAELARETLAGPVSVLRIEK